MRITAIVIGIILLIAGIWVLAGDPTYSSTETAASIGPLSVQTTHEKAIPRWTGIAGVVVGGVLVLGGLVGTRKR